MFPIPTDKYGTSDLLDKVYEVNLPDDYFHLLNCIVEYDVTKNYKCYKTGSKWQQGAFRLTSDASSQIINNFYMRPSYKRPYYFINNVNIDDYFPFRSSVEDLPKEAQDLHIISKNWNNITIGEIIPKGTFIYVQDGLTERVFYRALTNITKSGSTIGSDFELIAGSERNDNSSPWHTLLYGTSLVNKGFNHEVSSNEKPTRYGNRSKVRMEIRYGKDNKTFELSAVYIDYLKVPQHILLTHEQIDEEEDNSQLLEFPDYVAQEIVNELVRLLLENSSDPRLQSHIPINQTIAPPAQQR